MYTYVTHMHTYITHACTHTCSMHTYVTHTTCTHTHTLYAHTHMHMHACMHTHSAVIFRKKCFLRIQGGSEVLGKGSVCVSVPLFSRKDRLCTYISSAYHTRTQQWWLFSLAVLNNENSGYHMTHTHTHIRYSND